MAVHPSRWGKRFFPEIKLCVRTPNQASEIRLSPLAQIGALAAALATLSGLAYLGVCRVALDGAVAEREAAMMRVESANLDLQNTLAAVRDRLSETSRKLGMAQNRQSTLSSQSELLRGQLQTTEAQLDALDQAHQQLAKQKGEAQQLVNLSVAQTQVERLQAERATLSARLSKVESDRVDQQNQVAQYKADLDAMRARLDELQRKVSARESWRRVAAAQQAAAPAAAKPAAASGAVTPAAAANAGFGRNGLAEVARVLGAAGVDVGRLFARAGVERDVGGPFVAPAKYDPAAANKLAGTLSLLRSLPLSAPLDDYRMTAGFGERRDPFNRRAEFHTGVDLAAPYMTPVYATAPGTVTYAGWLDEYGKVVEIDHGHGISTWYAHLHRTLVSEGERVGAHTEIGLVGTTGRSTGPHVHYEVRVNGQPQDPEKFLELAHLIPVAQR